MNFQTHLENLKKLKLPEGQFIIISSGAMAVRGIREARDLDIVVTLSVWDELTKKYPVINKDNLERINLENDTIEILHPSHSVFADSLGVSVEEMFEKADVFDGIKFMSLEHLKKIKKVMAREKDLKDIELIDEYLKRKA